MTSGSMDLKDPTPSAAIEPHRGYSDHTSAILRFSLGPIGRRALVGGLGAACALGLGAAAAYAVRLPNDLSAPQTTSDQMLVQDELLSVTAARSYALRNPPTYALRSTAETAVIDDPNSAFDVDDQPKDGSSDTSSDTVAAASTKAQDPRLGDQAADPDAPASDPSRRL